MGRVGIVSGHKGHGKTTFVISGSKNAPDTMAEVCGSDKPFDCSDVDIIQLDNEGEIGASALGLQPTLHDFSDLAYTWIPLQKAMEPAIKAISAKAKAGATTIVGIDFGALVDAALGFWGETAKGFDLWSSARDSVESIIQPLRATPATIILMTHLKAYDPTYKGGSQAKPATAQQLETHKAKEEMRSDGHDVDFVLDISPYILKSFLRPASFIWVPRRVVESKIVAGKATNVARYWVDTDASDFAPSYTRGNTPMKKIVALQETRTLKAMLASLDSLKAKKV